MALEQLHTKIEKYLGKNMSEEEQVAFEQEMIKDPEVKKEVLFHVLANESVSTLIEDEVRAKFDAIREKKKATEEKKPEAVIIPFWRKKAFQIAIAACLIGVVSLTVFLGIGNSFEAEVMGFERDPVSKNRLGNGTVSDWDDCLSLFDDAQYDAAITCFKDTKSTEPEVQQFIGHCYFRKKDFSNARSQFEQLLQQDQLEKGSDQRAKVEWNWLLTLALEKDNRLSPLLDSVLQIPTYKYFQEALQLKKLVN